MTINSFSPRFDFSQSVIIIFYHAKRTMTLYIQKYDFIDDGMKKHETKQRYVLQTFVYWFCFIQIWIYIMFLVSIYHNDASLFHSVKAKHIILSLKLVSIASLFVFKISQLRKIKLYTIRVIRQYFKNDWYKM